MRKLIVLIFLMFSYGINALELSDFNIKKKVLIKTLPVLEQYFHEKMGSKIDSTIEEFIKAEIRFCDVTHFIKQEVTRFDNLNTCLLHHFLSRINGKKEMEDKIKLAFMSQGEHIYHYAVIEWRPLGDFDSVTKKLFFPNQIYGLPVDAINLLRNLLNHEINIYFDSPVNSNLLFFPDDVNYIRFKHRKKSTDFGNFNLELFVKSDVEGDDVDFSLDESLKMNFVFNKGVFIRLRPSKGGMNDE